MRKILLSIWLISLLTSLCLNLYSADIYWVGGSGSWNDASHWAATSGGVSCAKVPSINDNVFIDSLSFSSSGQSITITENAICNNFSLSTNDFIPELIGKNTSNLQIGGSFLIKNSFVDSYLGTISFIASSQNTIDISKKINANIAFNGTGSWVLNSDFGTNQNITLLSGSLSTNNNQISANTFDGNGSSIRSLLLGTSTVTVTSWLFGNTQNLTFDGSKAKIIVLGNWDTSLQKGNLFYNLITNSNKRSLTVDSIVVKPYKCDKNGKSTGKVTVYVSGVSSSASYKLYDGATLKQSAPTKPLTFTFDSLILDPSVTGHNYSVTVSKPGNADVIKSIVYPTVWTTPLNVSISTIKDVTCAGFGVSYDAQLKANPNGGVGPYTYEWQITPQQTTQTATGLTNGVWACKVVDTYSCTVTGTINYYPGGFGYTGPNYFKYTVDPVANTPSCSSQNNGTLSIKMTGGLGKRSFKIVSGLNTIGYQNDSVFNGLQPGLKYSIYGKDSIGCEMKAATDITIASVPEPIVNAGPDTTICSDLKVNLGSTFATNCSTSILWTKSAGADGTFTSTSIANPIYTPGPIDIKNGTVTLTITGTGDKLCSVVTDSKVVTISPIPTVTAGPDQSVCLSSLTYALSGASVANQNSIQWTRKGGGGTFSNTTIQNPSYTLNTVDTTSKLATLIISAKGNGGCSLRTVTDTMLFTMAVPPFVFAGTNQNICKGNTYSATTASIHYGSSILWTTSGNGVFSKNTIENPDYTPGSSDLSAGTVTLTAKAIATSPCIDLQKSITITLDDQPNISAGNDKKVCSNGPYALTDPTQLKCDLTTLKWSTSGDGNFNNSNNLLPIYTPGSNDNVFGTVTLSVSALGQNGCSFVTVTDAMTLTMVDSAVSIAGANQNICYGATFATTSAVAQNFGSLLWSSSGSAGTISDPTKLFTTYTPTPADKTTGSVILTLTSKGISPCPDKQSTLSVSLFDKPIIEIGPDDKVCSNGPYTLSNTTGSFYSALKWTTLGDGSYNDITKLNPIYTPGTTDNVNNSVKLKLEATGVGGCSTSKAYDSITVKLIDSVIVNAGINHTICKSNSVTINNATASNYSALLWKSNGSGVFSTPTKTLTDYTPSIGDLSKSSVKLKLMGIANAPCKDDSSEMTLSLQDLPTVFAGHDTTVCSKGKFNLLTATVSNITTKLWSTSGDGTFSSTSAINPSYTPGVNDKIKGSVQLRLTVSGTGSCGSTLKSDSLKLTMNDPPSAVYAGADISVCKTKPITISDATATNTASVLWSTNGTGTFSAGTSLKTSYNPSAADLTAGVVTLTLTGIAFPSCGDMADVNIVSMYDAVTAKAGKNDTICSNTSYTFVNDDSKNYSSLLWKSNGDGTFNRTDTLHPTYTPGANDLTKKFATLILNANGKGNCDPANSSMTLTIDFGPQISAGSDLTICYNSQAKIIGATGTPATYKSLLWTSAGDGTFDDATKLNPTYTPGTNDLSNHTVKLTLTANGISACKTAVSSMTVNVYPQLSTTITSNAPHAYSTKCFGSWDADAHINPSGGNPPYSYKWSDPKITGKDTLLYFNGTGIFTASVTDSKGCVASNTITVTEPAKIKMVFTQTDNICFNDALGSATVTAQNGVAPLSYLWSDGTTGLTANLLKAGYTSLTITDKNICTIADSVKIKEPPRLTSTFVNTLPKCPGDTTGAIVATAIGGTPGNYTYLWSNGKATNSLINLSTGSFTLTIHDKNSCVFDTTFTLPDPQPIAVKFDVTNVACYGDSTGQIIAHVTGGSKPYQFFWTDGINFDSIIKKSPVVTLQVDIYDKNFCELFSNPVSITQPSKFSVGVGKPSSFKISASTKIAVRFKGKHDMIQDVGFNLIAPDGTIHTLVQSPSITGSPTTPCNYGRNFDIGFTTEAVSTLDMCKPTPWPALWTDNNRINWPDKPSISGDYLPLTPWNSLYGSDPSNGGWALEIEDCFPLKPGELVDSSMWENASLSFTDLNTSTGLQETILFQQIGMNRYINQPISSCASTKYKIPMKMSTSCFGVCDAEGIMFPVGGLKPYIYKWSDPTIQSKDTNYLCAGNYTVTAYDKNGCTAIGGVNVTQPSKIVAKLDSISNLCFGKATGVAKATITSGGTRPFTFQWTGLPLSKDSVAKNLVAGRYFLTTTDDNNCPQIDSITVRDSLKVLTSIIVDSAKCTASLDGKIHLTPSGSYINPNFTYKWSNGQTNATDSVLAAGKYTVTVLDKVGCRLDTSATVPAPLPISFSGTIIKSPTCVGKSDGSISLLVNGGSHPITFAWKNAAWTIDSTRNKLENVPAGKYFLHVVDKNGCTRVDTAFTISDPKIMNPNISATDSVKCNGDATGKASVSVVNGLSPYKYNWSNGSNNSSITALSAGTYSITITDSYSCSVTASTLVYEPNAISLSSSILDSVSCNGKSDGRFKVSTLGGTKPYSFIWNNTGGTDSIVTIAKAGMYNVTVTDKNNCVNNATVSLIDPLLLDFKFKGQIKSSECSTKSGIARVEAKGGTRGYQYLWNDGFKDSTDINIIAGDYTVTITDFHGCTINTSIKVKDTTSLSISTKTIQKSITCKGRNDGSGYVIASGTNSYSYKWSNNSTNDTITKLLDGKYIVTVTDVYTCQRVDTLKIDTSNILSIKLNINNVSCSQNNNGSIQAIVSGGFPLGGYFYNWSNATNKSSISNLSVGAYSLTVSDTSNCKVTAQKNLIKDKFTASFVNTKDVLCHNTCNGSSIFSADKVIGTKPFKYIWENGETDSLAKALCKGITHVTVTDKMGCSYNDSVSIKDLLTSITIIKFDTVFTPCGWPLGKAKIHVTGGVPGYTYKWSNGKTADSIFSLFVGIYDITVTDANNCNIYSSVEIADTSYLPLAIKTVDVLACTPCTGKAIIYSIDPTNTDVYSKYKWYSNPALNNSTLTNACVGIQTVDVIREKDGCTKSYRDTVKKAKGLQISTDTLINRNCVYSKDAAAVVHYKNNLGPVSYKWSNGSTDSTAFGFGSETAYVTVSDGTCTLFDSVVFVDPLFPIEKISSTTVSCFNGNGPKGNDGSATITMLNGLVPDSLFWNDNKFNPQKTAKAINLPLGMYTATVYYSNDGKNACIYKDSVQVNQNVKLNVTWNITKNPHCNANDGEIVAVATGGVQFVNNNKYTFRWHAVGMDSIKLPQYNNDTINGIGVDYYVLNVLDSLNCSFTSPQILLTDNGDIQIVDKITGKPDSIRFPTCASPLINNGYYRVKPTGSNPPFEYKYWRYNLTVTDSVGAWWKLTTNNQVKGTGAADSLPEGSYKLYVTNGAASNCKSIMLFSIGNNYLTASTNKTDVTCPLVPDGTASVLASNGLPYLRNPKYRYKWDMGSVKDSIKGLNAKTYSVTVTDSIGCAVTRSVSINNPVFMTITMPDTVQTACYSDTAKTIIPIINGGQGPYFYNWDNGKSTANKLVSPDSGWHKVIVHDKGCFVATDSVYVQKKGYLKWASNPYDTTITKCGMATGKITVHVLASSKPLAFAWNPIVANDSVITNLAVDYYTVTVTDANPQKCTLIKTIKIEDSSTVAFKIKKIADVHCSTLGKALVDSIIGGTFPYDTTKINWLNHSFKNETLWGKKVDSLHTGIIEVRIIDFKSCTGLDTIRILSDSVFNVTLTTINDISCKGSIKHTGSITVNASNGKTPYKYAWDKSKDTVSFIDSLSAGSYLITVSDSYGCTVKDSATILYSPLKFSSKKVKQTNVSCFGKADGSLTVLIDSTSGSGKTVSYKWSNGDITAKADSLLANKPYKVTIIDPLDSSCFIVDSFAITQPNKLIVSKFSNIKDPTCKDSSGIIIATVIGGIDTLPYSYAWSNSNNPKIVSTTDSIKNYWTDLYKISVTDANKCITDSSVQFKGSLLLAVHLDSIADAKCKKESNGYIRVKTTNAVGTPTFTWLNSNSIKSIASGLKAGSYTVTAVDDNGCKDTLTATVKEPDTLTISFPRSSKITCYGKSDTIISHLKGGNTGTHKLSWSKVKVDLNVNDTIISNATIGTYSVSVTDSKGCFASDSIVITQATKITVKVDSSNTGCGASLATGSARVISMKSEYMPTTIKWWNSSTDSLVSGIKQGVYRVQITDAKGCTVTDSTHVLSDNFDSLKIDTVQMAKCNYNSPTGILQAKAYGSVKPYTWLWNVKTADKNDSIIKKLSLGRYFVTVTGKTGCLKIDSADITPMVNIEAAITSTKSNSEVTTINFCKNDSTTLIGSNTKRIIHYKGILPSKNEQFLWTVKDGNTDSLIATMNKDNGDSIKVKPYEPTTYQLWYSIYGCSVPVKEVSLSYYENIGLSIDILKDGETLHDTARIIRGYKLELQPHDDPWFVKKDSTIEGFMSYKWTSYDTTLKRDGVLNEKLVDEPYYNIKKTASIEVSPLNSSWYVIVGKNTHGCYERDSVKITVEPEFTIPSGISPNGDGINDKWNLPYLKQFPEARVTVFNRWGIIIWEKNKDYNSDPFVGKNKDGKELPLGTYYYLIEFNDDKGTKPRAGSITIVR